VTGGAVSERVGLFSSSVRGFDAGQVIELAASLRLGSIEWGAGPGEAIERPRDAHELGQLCRASGLAVSGLCVQDPEVSLATPRAARPYVHLSASLGADFVRLFAPPYQGGRLTRELRRVRAGLDAVVDMAAAVGVAALVETAPETLAPTPGLAVSLVEHHPPERAGVLYDPGNTVIEGYLAPPLAAACLKPHLRHVHVKNIAWGRRSGRWEWRYATLTGGFLDWRGVLSSLAGAGYTGSFSIDHLSGKPSLAALRAETQLLRKLVREASAPKVPPNHSTTP
jgi:sugar phosphate isomerase/epimerase